MKKIIWCLGILVFTASILFLTPFVFRAKDTEGEINCFVNFENTYTKCPHITTFKTLAKESFANEEEIKIAYPSWKIKMKDDENIYLTKETDNYCKDHFIATLNENKITVKYLSDNSVYTSFYIPLKYLSENDIAELKKGKILNSKEEFTAFTEDFTS